MSANMVKYSQISGLAFGRQRACRRKCGRNARKTATHCIIATLLAGASVVAARGLRSPDHRLGLACAPRDRAPACYASCAPRLEQIQPAQRTYIYSMWEHGGLASALELALWAQGRLVVQGVARRRGGGYGLTDFLASKFFDRRPPLYVISSFSV